MKSLLGTLVILCSLQSFAGPEEHIAAQTCYVPSNQAMKATIPQRVCLEEIFVSSVDGAVPALNIYSYFSREYFQDMTLTYLARHNEDSYSFRGSKILLQNWESGCGSAEKVTLEVSGRVDNDGLGLASAVDVSVKYETTNDTCHSKAQVNIYEYTKEH